MSKTFGNIIGKVNEAVGAVKANANHASVREDGVKQEELGKKQQHNSADADKQAPAAEPHVNHGRAGA